MAEMVELWEQPEADEIYMIAGWRQWADGGAVSSALPPYLIEQMGARQIGVMHADDCYLFQIPGTHDLVRPEVKFDEGYPTALERRKNELFYTGDERRGVVIFLGDEPHLGIERYTAALLDAARTLKVKRIVGLGGVYGEFPYDKERVISSNYSLPELKEEVQGLAVNLSGYQGGASIGSFLCRLAGDAEMEWVAFYALVPMYDFSNMEQMGSAIRIENDYTAWLGVMRRVNYMLKLGFDLSDLEQKSRNLIERVREKVEELDQNAPELGVQEYLARVDENFQEVTFDPLDVEWEEEVRRLLDDVNLDDL